MPRKRKTDEAPPAEDAAETAATGQPDPASEITAPAEPVAQIPVPEAAAPPAADGFAALELQPPLLEAVRGLGFEEPTPIQRRTIPLLLEGRDVIAQAQTGTGKTAAFALPLLQRLDPEVRGVQALILAPTRELAVQVAGSVHALGRHMGVTVLPIYGGQPIERQLRALRLGVQVVIGTPGRILDHLRRGSLSLGGVKTLVLDEADEMLDMGFEEEIEAILADVPAERQTSLFSATIPPRIASLAQRYLNDAVRVAIEAERLTVPQINQTYYEVAPHAKLEALTRILDMEAPGAAIIFCRTKRDVDEIGESLLGRGYPAETLHGDLSQPMRDRVMRRFREGQAELLVATDVAARGLDVEHVSHVINFNIPEDPEQYVHRIGRTARAGRSGDAITLVTPREMRWLREIERLIRKKIKPARVPTAGDIAARRLELTKEAVERAIREGGLDPYLLAVEELAGDGDLAQVAAAALKLMLERDGSAGRTTVTAIAGDAALGVETGMQRLFVDLGRKQGIRPSDIVGIIANEAGVPGRTIGAIDIYDSFTFVEVASDIANRVIEALQGSTLRGKEFHVDIARPRDERPPAAEVAPATAGSDIDEDQDEDEAMIPAQPALRTPRGAPGPNQRARARMDKDVEEEDEEPPQRPAGWRDGTPPRPAPRYSQEMGGRRPLPRRGPSGSGREGFGPYRGPEQREAPPWQRRQMEGAPRPEHRGDFERGDAQRPRRPEGGYAPRRDEGGFRPRRNPEQQGFHGPRPDDRDAPRRNDFPPSGPGRRRPGGPPPRPPRRHHDD